MLILGVSCYFHDAAAVLIRDGKLVAAAEEERFTRKKHDYSFPSNAIHFCLEKGGITAADLDYVVFFEKPFLKLDRLLRTSLQGFPFTYKLFRESMQAWLLDKLWIKSQLKHRLPIDQKKILFSEHHLSHAASAYFCSPFPDAAILTIDGVGEWNTTTMGRGKGNDLVLTHEQHFPHSIGLLYSVFTAFLGFEVNEGEYKVMGMAPYGQPLHIDKVRKLVRWESDGSFWLDCSYFSFHRGTKQAYSRKFLDLFGPARDPNVPFFTETSEYPSYYGERPRNFQELAAYNQGYADVAASIQVVTEELILGLVREVHRRTGQTSLCLAGGVALNSVANGRILRETPITHLYIQPSAGDGGGALGAALMGWHVGAGRTERFTMEHAYWGEEYSDGDVVKGLEVAGLRGTYAEDDDRLLALTTERLLAGKVVGWYQGRFEWGPRALGNRSILADPRRAQAKDTVNTKVKFREPFRPFAPSVLADAAEQFFDLPDAQEVFPARFMLLVSPVKAHQQSVIPAVSHMGTARLQTVFEETNPLYHGLIKRFGKATGVPVLLNTSFNVKGEPIVNTPENAIRTFSNSGIDTLVMNRVVVDKPS